MDIKPLINLGLNEKAANIYLAALSLGTSTVQDLAKACKIKRPTAYFHIEELLEEGFIEKVPLGKKDYYRAVDPKLIQQKADQQYESIQSLIPQLINRQQEAEGKPQVRFLEGRKGLQQIYKEVAEANSIRFWADLTQIEKHFLKDFQNISKAINKNQIQTREILPNTNEAIKSSRRFAMTAGSYYKAKIANKGEIFNDNIIYNNVLVMIRIQEYNLYAVRIEDETIVQTMKTMFDMAWESAKPL